MAQQGGGGQQQGQGGESNDMMWAAAFFAFFLIILWLARNSWLPYVLTLKLYELQFASFFVSVDSELVANIDQAIVYTDQITDDKIFFYLLSRVGQYYSIPVAIILFIFAIIIYIRNPATKFNKSFSISSFRKFQAVNWPQILPPSQYDLINADITTGPWASSHTPLSFAQKYKLLDVIENKNFNPLLGELAKVAKLREGKARQLLASQLGYLWQGPEKLPIHAKALFAVFAAIGNEDRKAGLKYIRQYNDAFFKGKKPDFSGVDDLLNKYKNTKHVKKIQEQHAYVMTVMAAMLEYARSDGVLASADFLWLKTIDRPLWYMLNNVGRRSAFPEVAGAFAHWKIEARMQRKIVTPMIEEAVKALKVGINEIIYPQDD